jgi:hypothetical protein
VAPGRVEQDLRADDVGRDERVGRGGRAVDGGLGGEVDDRVVGAHHHVGQGRVGHVAGDEVEPFVVGDRAEAGEARRVRKLVEDRDPRAGEARQSVGEQGSHEVRAEEAGAAGDQEVHQEPSL